MRARLAMMVVVDDAWCCCDDQKDDDQGLGALARPKHSIGPASTPENPRVWVAEILTLSLMVWSSCSHVRSALEGEEVVVAAMLVAGEMALAEDRTIALRCWQAINRHSRSAPDG